MSLIFPDPVMSPETTRFLAAWPRVREISHGLAFAIASYTASFIVIAFFEYRSGKSLADYASRNFWTDILYRALFVVYLALIYNPLVGLLRPVFPAMHQNILTRAPFWIAFAAYWLVFDFLSYWTHRAQHSRLWWRFHRIHHSQEKMTFATGFRNHPLDQLFAHSVSIVPSILLGAPVIIWLPYAFLTHFLDAIHHSRLPWRFAPLRKILVSPIFHAAHHSSDPAVHDRNFGGLFSMWDFMFGTAYDADQPPHRTGVQGWRVHESLWSHFLSPFRRDTIAPDDELPPKPGAR
jgi:sterol desaturase/sphingolipid hydroxylase (fatty acid hydroxylase superfamily)